MPPPAVPTRRRRERAANHERVAMKYIDAGYAIAFGVLAAYAATLVRRRQRLEKTARPPARRDP